MTLSEKNHQEPQEPVQQVISNICDIFQLVFSDALVNLDVALHIGEKKGSPALTSSLLLSAASPFLLQLLLGLDHCDGCNSRKTIILAEEEEDTVHGLFDLLHTKYLKQGNNNQVTKDVEQLCQRLGISASPSSLQSMPRPPSDEESRGEEAGEPSLPQPLGTEPSRHESQEDFARKDAMENREDPSLSVASSRPIRKGYLVSIPLERIGQSSREKIENFQTRKKQKKKRHVKHRKNCGSCSGCDREEDCGNCHFCLDKHKFGGEGIQKQKCKLKWCKLKIPKHKRKYWRQDTRDSLEKQNIVAPKHATQQNYQENRGGESTKLSSPKSAVRVREFFITRGKRQSRQRDNDPENAPLPLRKRSKPMLFDASDQRKEGTTVQPLKCFQCGKKEKGRSHMYGHYARCHFKDDLFQRLQGNKKDCEEHNLSFKTDSEMVTHYGSVHDMVEEFLPSSQHIPRGISAATLSTSKGVDAELEEVDKGDEKRSGGGAEDRNSCPAVRDCCEKEVKRGFLQLGRQKRDREKAKTQEEFGEGDSDDFIKKENRSTENELLEEDTEQGKNLGINDQEISDEESNIDVKDNVFEEVDLKPNLIEEIDVKENIYEDVEDTRSPRTLLTEFLEGSLDDD